MFKELDRGFSNPASTKGWKKTRSETSTNKIKAGVYQGVDRSLLNSLILNPKNPAWLESKWREE